MARATSLIIPGTDERGGACVFKSVRPEDAGREDITLRLRNEAAVLTHLAGTPGVIRLLDVRTAPLTLVLELADGGSLDERLRTPLSRDSRRQIAHELVAAVAACHARGVTHRDIKPSNILFVGDALRLADFGVAAWGEPRRALPAGWEEDEVGTPPWSAPELRQHATDAVSPFVDVYGVAMTLRAVLDGDAPPAVAAGCRVDPGQRASLDELARALA